MRVVLIDNRDSFTWNIEQQVRLLGAECTVIHGRTAPITDVERLRPERIILSPGPGRPEAAALSLAVLRAFAARVPILGVCLGHQCLGVAFGRRGSVVHAPEIVHGRVSHIYHRGERILQGLPSPFVAARYHSLLLRTVPEGFLPLCWTGTQKCPSLLMGVCHTSLPIFGVQFHPESFLTEHGDMLMRNFLAGRW